MTITTTNYYADGVSRRFGARQLDDAATPAAAVFYPGFRPTYVRVINLTDRIEWEWFEGITAGTCLKTVAAGTRTLDTTPDLTVVSAAGSEPSITLAASVTLQNKQYQVVAS